MEEFFNRSLERFDELPSDDVWTNVSERLTAEENWYDPIWASLKLIFPFLLALLLMGLYYFNTQKNIKQLNHQLTEANTTIQNLKSKHQTTINNLNSSTKTKDQLQSTIHQNNERFKNLDNNYSLLNNKYALLLNKTTTQSTPQITNQQINKIQALQKQITDLQFALNQKEAELIALKAGCNQENNSKTSTNNKANNQQPTDLFCNNLQHTLQLRPLNLTINNALKTKLDLLRSTAPTKQNTTTKEQEEQEEEIKRQNHNIRIGIKTRYFNALVQNSILVNPGFSNGLRTEIGLNNKWAVTGDLLYNSQVYTIDAGQTTFSKTSLERYPGGLEDNTNINIITARTRYFDASPGIKFTPNYAPDKFNFFINPSVVWHLYLPQEYQFNLRQESNVLYKENTIIAYLGSGNLSVGFEKRISPKIHFQINLWGEQSFIPLGYERHYITKFGVSSAILF